MPDQQPVFSIIQPVGFAQAASQLRQGTSVMIEFADRAMKATVSTTTGFQPEGEPAFPQVYEIEITNDGLLEEKYAKPEDAIDAAVTYLREQAL